MLNCISPKKILNRIALLYLLLASSVHATCWVDVNSLAFGNYNPFAPQPTDTVARIDVQCHDREEFAIELGPGLSDQYFPRLMQRGNARLRYNIYTNRNRTRVWGDGSNGTRRLIFNRRNLRRRMFGRIPPGQRELPTGRYSDIVVVHLDF